jgi:hypothetical protein
MKTSWFCKTKQSWKVWVFFLLTLLSLSTFVLFVWRVNYPNTAPSLFSDEITLSLSFVWSGLVSLGWLGLSVRCPECRKSVAGHILSTAPASTWFTALITLQECPLCGYAAVDRMKAR